MCVDEPDVFFDFGYGAWVVNFQYFLLYFLPVKLNVNLQYWAQTVGVSFISITLSSLIFCYYLFISSDSKKPENLFLSFSSCSLLILLFKEFHFVDFFLYSGFFRFVFPGVLLILSLYYLYKLFLCRKVNGLILFGLSFITCSSSELVTGIFVLSVLYYLFYKISIFIYLKKKIKIKYCMPFFFLFTGCISGTLYFLSQESFLLHFSGKANLSSFGFASFFSLFPDFISQYYKRFISDFYWLYFIFIYEIVAFRKKELPKNIQYSLLLILSMLTLFASFIFYGKNSYTSDFWFVHDDIYFVFIPVFVLVMLLILKTLLSQIVTTKNKYCFVISVLLFLVIIPSINGVLELKSKIHLINKYGYIRDKIRLFYHYRNETPEASVHLLSKMQFIGYSQKFAPIDEGEYMQDFYHALDSYYYPSSYGVYIKEPVRDVNIIEHYELLKKFKENGGTIDEVYKNKYDFRNLSNRNFVLNVKKD